MTKPDKFPPFHFELLNEIHAHRAARHLVAPRHFPDAELIEIGKFVGDMPTWDQHRQPQLVRDTLHMMALRAPFVEEDAQ